MNRIAGIMFLLSVIIVAFSVLFYEVEYGKPCYIGERHCDGSNDSELMTLRNGIQVAFNKDGSLTGFGNILYAVWFSVVTLTTTGYGDILPITHVGKFLCVLLIIIGTFYMAFPLTVSLQSLLYTK
jgi:hypothetical protein